MLCNAVCYAGICEIMICYDENDQFAQLFKSKIYMSHHIIPATALFI